MLTQCPECQTTFRITHAILRAANGQVRCGRCRTQFDASSLLLDDEGLPVTAAVAVDPPRVTSEPPPPSTNNIVVEEPQAQEDITLEGQRIEITGTYRVPKEAFALDASDEEVVHETHVIESTLPDEAPVAQPAGAGFESTGQMRARRVADEDAELLREAESRLDATDAEAAALDPESQESEPRAAPVSTIDGDIELLAGRPQRKPTALLWTVALPPLAILLLVQLVHHERAELARHPRVGPWLGSIYSSMGMPLDPDWDLRAYDLKQRGVIADPSTPGTLTVRASITNRAGYPQPYPLLKLVLEDRWGSAVRAREFRPDEYAPAGQIQGLLGPNQKTEARIAIADPGPEAEGFRFDLCLKRSGGLVCAEEAPLR
jgi:predicted Zn finger-like uncharacterized protein